MAWHGISSHSSLGSWCCAQRSFAAFFKLIKKMCVMITSTTTTTVDGKCDDDEDSFFLWWYSCLVCCLEEILKIRWVSIATKVSCILKTILFVTIKTK